jgi:hypothetical protein
LGYHHYQVVAEKLQRRTIINADENSKEMRRRASNLKPTCKRARITCKSKTIDGMSSKRAAAYIYEVDENKRNLKLA